MNDWPVIDEPELLRRIGLEHEAFVAMMAGIVATVGRRDFGDEQYELALGYPWPRPPESFVLDGERVEPLGGAPEPVSGRHPLLAFGSNGNPATLIRKFAHLAPRDRRITVLAGDLDDFDVAAAAYPAAYGSFPATLFPSPGAALRASLLWVTPAQLTALAWTEISYLFGALEGVRFEPDVPGAEPVARVLAFVSRWGAHGVDGRPAALAALDTRGRSVPAYSQEQLLDRLAVEAIGAGAGARELVAWIFEDFGAAAQAIAPLTTSSALAFEYPGWRRFEAG